MRARFKLTTHRLTTNAFRWRVRVMVRWMTRFQRREFSKLFVVLTVAPEWRGIGVIRTICALKQFAQHANALVLGVG